MFCGLMLHRLCETKHLVVGRRDGIPCSHVVLHLKPTIEVIHLEERHHCLRAILWPALKVESLFLSSPQTFTIIHSSWLDYMVMALETVISSTHLPIDAINSFKLVELLLVEAFLNLCQSVHLKQMAPPSQTFTFFKTGLEHLRSGLHE